MLQNAVSSLSEYGYSDQLTFRYYYDDVEKEIETSFLPWLTSEVTLKLDHVNTARKVIDSLILDALRSM